MTRQKGAQFPSKTDVGTEMDKKCQDRGLNTGPLELQSTALPAELSRRYHTIIMIISLPKFAEEGARSVEPYRAADFRRT